MKKFIKNLLIVVIILLCIFSIIKVSFVLAGYMQVKEEKKLYNQKIELHDNKLNENIKEMLTHVFEKGNSQLDEQTFSQNYNISEFFEDTYGNTGEMFNSAGIMYLYFLYQLKDNYNKENLKININIEKVYELKDSTYEVRFIVEREFNYKDDKKLIKTEAEYNANVLRDNGEYLIKEIYNIKDFNNYINKEHEISKYYIKKNKLYREYLRFKFGQYSDLEEGFITKSEILN